jgi:hypothetical protein
MVAGNEFPIGPSEPVYVTGMPAGDHLVSLDAPPSCSVENDRQSVTVATGGFVRDTVEVTFSVTCTRVHGNVQITAHTIGPLPSSTRYAVWYEHFSNWGYGGEVVLLGVLDPNGTLVAELPASRQDGGDPYWYNFGLKDTPSNCNVSAISPSPNPGFTVPAGGVLDLDFEVTCSP